MRPRRPKPDPQPTCARCGSLPDETGDLYRFTFARGYLPRGEGLCPACYEQECRHYWQMQARLRDKLAKTEAA